MKRIVITADDYGMSKGVNDAIDEGIAVGLITSTNVMTNMDFYRDAIKLRKTSASIGIHWTLSAGRPVCAPKEIPTLVDSNGMFFSYAEFRKRYRRRQISDKDIERELRAQYLRFVEVCGEPDYWNTHQNVHVDFRIFKLFVKIASELHIPKMRSHQRVYIPSSDGRSSLSWKWRLLEPIKRCILRKWMKYARRYKMKSPHALTVAMKNEDLKDIRYCFSNLSVDSDQIVEHVIHPSTALDSPYFGSIGATRIREYEQFTSELHRTFLEEIGFEVVSFERV